MNNKSELKINGYSLIISIAIILSIIYINVDKFNDKTFSQSIIIIGLFFEFIFIAGVLEQIKSKNVINIILYTFFSLFSYYVFIKSNDDILKMFIVIIAVIPLFMLIKSFAIIMKDILSIDEEKDKIRNVILFIFNTVAFLLAILQIVEIIIK